MNATHPRSAPANAGPVGIKMFFRITERWGLGSKEQQTILGVPANTFYRWRRDPDKAQPDRNTQERIAYLIGMYKSLHILFPDPTVADGFMQRNTDHPFFHHRRPLDRLLGGQVADLYEVHRYLDGLRGGWR